MDVVIGNNTFSTELFNYQEFKTMVENLLSEGKVTGETQSEALFQTTEMNLHRVNRIEKKGVLEEGLVKAVEEVEKKYTWYVIVEGWCGDASQNVPFIEKIAGLSEKIDLKLLLRDENPEMINAYLTNGAKAIPKVVCVDTVTNKEVWTWGPRPQKIQDLVLDYKKENPEMVKADFAKKLHVWYSRDKGKALQEEFLTLVTKMK